MPVHLSIKNAPDEVVQRLRRRAERHHRSLQGELLVIIEEAVQSEQRLSPTELLSGSTALAFGHRPTRPQSSGRSVTGINVMDASALAALLFAEPEAEAISNWRMSA